MNFFAAEGKRTETLEVARAEAERIRKIGQAEAEAIAAVGKSQAETMKAKAASYANFGNAGVSSKNYEEGFMNFGKINKLLNFVLDLCHDYSTPPTNRG